MQDLRERILGLTAAVTCVNNMTSVPEILDGLMSSMLTLLNLTILSKDGKGHVQVSVVFFFVGNTIQENLLFVFCLKKTRSFFQSLQPVICAQRPLAPKAFLGLSRM